VTWFRRPHPAGAARLPASKLDIVDVGHYTWEDAADEYAALGTSWWSGGYATAGSVAGR
jgi:hypothetical protein